MSLGGARKRTSLSIFDLKKINYKKTIDLFKNWASSSPTNFFPSI